MNVFLDISFEEYQKLKAISRSDLININKSIKHFLISKNEKKTETEAMRFGKIVHKFILEEKKFFETYFVSKKIRRAGKEWDEIVLKAEGKEIIWEEELDEINKIRNSLLENKIISDKKFLEDPISEKSAVWIDKDTEIECKCRFDILRMNEKNSILDLKTCCELDNSDFNSDVFRRKYHLQAAYYIDGFEALTNMKCDFFIFIVVEKKSPYCNGVFYLERDSVEIEQGRLEYKELLKKYKNLKENNFNYQDELTQIKMPSWYIRTIQQQ